MEIFEIVGTVADIIGIAEPIKTKFKRESADYKEFIAALNKIIKAACKVYREFIGANHDYKDIFFPMSMRS